jgi:hypothetical protein
MGQQRTSSGVQRMWVENQVQFTSDIQKLVQIRLKEDSNPANDSLLVDGYTSQKTFTLGNSSDYDIFLYEIRFVFSTEQFKFDGRSFGSSPELTNGVSIKIYADGYETEVFNVKCNEDFMLFNSPSNFVTVGYGSNDVMSAGLLFGGEIVLEKGSADRVQIIISDDLTDGLHNYFKCMIYGTKGEES